MVQVSNLGQFPMERLSLALHTIPLSFWFFRFLELFFSYMIYNCISTVLSYFSRSSSSSIIYKSGLSGSFKARREGTNQDFDKLCEEHVDDGSLSREDVETVMNNLGIFYQPEDLNLRERFSSDEFSDMFEEKEASLDEVKDAFDVFDDNHDGFIDAIELQKVVRALGLNENSEMENCKRMISVFDENGDGRIDFEEFVKLMD
ncbi:putative calcium-binding protein CML45 [Apium graveolens]|uniref:putative calcium-binding protein CML45 n=1 Tax=Apium graveolens TaxID=4045 RepID=UPI003D7C0A84